MINSAHYTQLSSFNSLQVNSNPYPIELCINTFSIRYKYMVSSKYCPVIVATQGVQMVIGITRHWIVFFTNNYIVCKYTLSFLNPMLLLVVGCHHRHVSRFQALIMEHSSLAHSSMYIAMLLTDWKTPPPSVQLLWAYEAAVCICGLTIKIANSLQ
jgi:hypothetical protein